MMQFVLFALVGCAAAVAHYGTLIVLAELAGVGPVSASAAGFVAGAAVSYALNYRYVFRSDREHLPTAARFLTVALFGLGLNSLVMAALTHRAGLHYLASQVAATLAVMLWSYGANRFWTFGGDAAPRSS
ncbi:GtrA family protein [Arenibaculum pallidiluteum]|uniref:GtrA family protein n=1 Tax=Arenibaculum pallidiluteum TaxID=2812559 RepID=UPI001A97BA28|nr:GtrA family protein [Arenibaculum pallidiluteum]